MAIPSEAEKIKLSALLTTSANGDEEAVRSLVQDEGVSTNVKDANGWTPLMRAAHGGHKGIVNLLLTAKTPASTRSQNKFGKTALHYACANGHSLIARVLLVYGADPKHHDTSGRTPFDDAMDNGQQALVVDLSAKLPGVKLPSKPSSPPILFKADATTLVVSWDPVKLVNTATTSTTSSGSGGRMPPDAEELLTTSSYRLQIATVTTPNSTTATGNATPNSSSVRRWTLIASDITTPTHKIRGLVPGTSYITRVGAANAYGWGEYSDMSDCMTTAPPPLSSSGGGNDTTRSGNTSPAAGSDTNNNNTAGSTGFGSPEAGNSNTTTGLTSPGGAIMFWGTKPAPSSSSSGASSSNNNSNSIRTPSPSGTGATSSSSSSSRPSSASKNNKKPSSNSSSGYYDAYENEGKYTDDADEEDYGGGSGKATRNSSSSSTTTTGKPPRIAITKSGKKTQQQSAIDEQEQEDQRLWAGADMSELREVLRTLQLDLEEEQSKRRAMDTELAKYKATPAALSNMSVDDLTGLESSLEEQLKTVRAAKEKKMKEALGDEMSRTLCAVCLTKPKNMLFLPCKHLCACSECAARIMKPLPDGKGVKKEPQCPICRVGVASVLDVYS